MFLTKLCSLHKIQDDNQFFHWLRSVLDLCLIHCHFCNIILGYQVRVTIDSPITQYGQENKNRATHQRIPMRVSKDDDDGVEHFERFQVPLQESSSITRSNNKIILVDLLELFYELSLLFVKDMIDLEMHLSLTFGDCVRD